MSTEATDVAWPGGLSTIFTQFTSVGTTTSYTDPYGDYREYRCLGMSMEYCPLFQPVQTTDAAAVNCGHIQATSIEKTPNGTAYIGTALITMADNTSFEIHPAGKIVKRVVKMNGTEEAAWSSTAVAAVSQFSIGLLLDTRVTHNPAATVAGTAIIRRLMQWRNKFN